MNSWGHLTDLTKVVSIVRSLPLIPGFFLLRAAGVASSWSDLSSEMELGCRCSPQPVRDAGPHLLLNLRQSHRLYPGKSFCMAMSSFWCGVGWVLVLLAGVISTVEERPCVILDSLAVTRVTNRHNDVEHIFERGRILLSNKAIRRDWVWRWLHFSLAFGF